MQKYIAMGTCTNEGELWFLVDAESVEQAKQLVKATAGDTFEVSACVKFAPNKEVGVTHKFKLVE